MSIAAPKHDRLAVRMSSSQKQSIEQAAAVLGRSISDFSVEVLTERANEILADQRFFVVSSAGWDEFNALLDAPVRPSPDLIRLMRRPSLFDE